jgi:hypothetical protein
MTTLQAPLPPEYADLTARLDTIGAHFRLAFTVRALAGFVLVVFPITLAVLFLAGSLPLPASLKVILLAALAVAVVVGYIAFLHRPLFHRPTYAEIARLIEYHGTHPPRGRAAIPIDNALINAVLLAQDLESASAVGPLRGSSAWIPHVLREATAATDDLPLEHSVPWRQPRNAWIITAAAVLLGVLWIALAPATFAHGISVLLTPTRHVPHQGSVRILSVLPGNDTALAGQPLLFSVTVDVPDHRSILASLTIYPSSGKVAT